MIENGRDLQVEAPTRSAWPVVDRVWQTTATIVSVFQLGRHDGRCDTTLEHTLKRRAPPLAPPHPRHAPPAPASRRVARWWTARRPGDVDVKFCGADEQKRNGWLSVCVLRLPSRSGATPITGVDLGEPHRNFQSACAANENVSRRQTDAGPAAVPSKRPSRSGQAGGGVTVYPGALIGRGDSSQTAVSASVSTEAACYSCRIAA